MASSNQTVESKTDIESLRAQLAESQSKYSALLKDFEKLELESGQMRSALLKLKAPERPDLPAGAVQLSSCFTVVADMGPNKSRLIDAKAGDVLLPASGVSAGQAAEISKKLAPGQRCYVVVDASIEDVKRAMAES